MDKELGNYDWMKAVTHAPNMDEPAFAAAPNPPDAFPAPIPPKVGLEPKPGWLPKAGCPPNAGAPPKPELGDVDTLPNAGWPEQNK